MEQRECFRDEEELFLYLDDELGAGRKLELKTHLLTCESCSTRFEVAYSLKAAVGRLSEGVTAPSWLREKIVRAISEEEKIAPRPFWDFLVRIFGRRPFVPVSAAALLVVVLMAALFYGRPVEGNMPFIRELVHEHYEYLEEAADLGLESGDPAEISGWILANTGMNINLPPVSESFSPEGACALREDDETIGYVYFDSEEKRISLFMLEDKFDKLSGQKTMRLGDISLYCGSCTGMNYVLWENGDVLCVLVGGLPEASLVNLARRFI
jgi:hypothetical protein